MSLTLISLHLTETNGVSSGTKNMSDRIHEPVCRSFSATDCGPCELQPVQYVMTASDVSTLDSNSALIQPAGGTFLRVLASLLKFDNTLILGHDLKAPQLAFID